MMRELATYSPSSTARSAWFDLLEVQTEGAKKGTLTYDDRPDIDEDEERDIRELLQREDVWKDMIWYTLRKAIQWMESMACIRRGHNPPVMRFVQPLVYQRLMQTPVNPIDEEVGE